MAPVRLWRWLGARVLGVVLFDATCRTWVLRHFARAFAQMSLVVVPVLLIVPGPLWIRLAGILLGFLVALQYALYNMCESVEHRVWKAGFPRATTQAKRDEATSEERAAAAARYAARYRRSH